MGKFFLTYHFLLFCPFVSVISRICVPFSFGGSLDFSVRKTRLWYSSTLLILIFFIFFIFIFCTSSFKLWTSHLFQIYIWASNEFLALSSFSSSRASDKHWSILRVQFWIRIWFSSIHGLGWLIFLYFLFLIIFCFGFRVWHKIEGGRSSIQLEFSHSNGKLLRHRRYCRRGRTQTMLKINK